MRLFTLLASLLLAAVLFAQQAPPPHSRVLLAVFAHPDDEAFAGPILTRYSREGVHVYLAIATKGEKGVNDFAKIPAGDPLAAARRTEATCACQQLGIEAPIFFNLNDGELGAITNPLAKNIHAVADNVRKLIDQLQPQVIITWGPDGGYGHPDHRLVSDAVTQVVQSQNSGIKLYYPGLTPAQAKPLNTIWPASLQFHTTDPAYLTVTVSYMSKDFQKFKRAFECHKSQYTSETFQALEKAMDAGWNGSVSFREWNSTRLASDLFH
ncbi:MAG TPA: PIG-L deacetylase family protein [Candidatus Eisenbacteria bacterium]|jgi:LmbE family N-acetylglucosaminyl deacetylase|nr:PIG-L deacetylase family protein [Candidatus Eisenbacteria bacterium]